MSLERQGRSWTMMSRALKRSRLAAPLSRGSFRMMRPKLKGEARKFLRRSSICICSIQSVSSSGMSLNSSFSSWSFSLAIWPETLGSSLTKRSMATKLGSLATGVLMSLSWSSSPNLWILTRSKALQSFSQQGSVPWWL